MILIGDNNIPFEEVQKVKDINDFLKTKPNTLVLFNYQQKMVEYCSKNSLIYAVVIKDLKEAIYANALSAKYIICEKSISKDIQEVADNYMFDSKILAIIDSNEEFIEIAKNQIDGIIYRSILK
ncbi:hypothetical protein CPU12_06765 [Malaciobacter molluscorum LMG 25693]|uniref:Uncharacterized protein n=1 Tax=Malaciobacter molluscorum LMG 25693 TaxID=870501 RepID=A0A2G1DI91_9BACT|nr:hypothetical protein [Malaciobacter molluscorum]AXX92391.1 hypothetical protein AMOL_1416 [Malaciobacter molluscorum LMG 25693]PHO18219.1 hypothetical protein CPU12_06765 [Malaciobacter molluscorum LMG 25693]RXJ94008.1 hypothetical protein CRV00_08710 [Malaciobacter molluscorum]